MEIGRTSASVFGTILRFVYEGSTTCVIRRLARAVLFVRVSNTSRSLAPQKRDAFAELPG